MSTINGSTPNGVVPPPQPPADGTGSGRLWAQLAGIAAIITIACVLLLVPQGPFFGKALAVGAILVIISQVLGLIAWCGDGCLGLPHLRMMLWRVFVTRMLALSAVVVVGFWIHSGLTVTATVAFAILLISHVRTPRRIKRRIDAMGAPLTKRKKHYWSYDEKNKVATLAVSHSFAEAVADIFNVFGSWRRIPALAPLAIAVALILCTTALAVGIITGNWIEHTSSGSGAKGGGTTTPTPPAHHILKPQVPTSSTTVTTPAPSPWDGKCVAVRQYSGATTKAKHSVSLLYETESGMTHLHEGCFGQIVHYRYTFPNHKWENYFTTVGTNPQSREDLTFAVDSEHFGAYIFMWAVASLIQALIAKVGPVGGVGRFPQYQAGASGDFYLVRSRVGIFVFIRRKQTESYIELPPTVARAWLGDMKAVHEWLWPSPPENGLKGEILFQLWSNNHTQIEGTVKWIPSTGLAERGHVPYPAKPVIELNLSELTKLANSA